MLLKGRIKFLIATKTGGQHLWLREAKYSSAKSAKAAIKVLRRNGWMTRVGYPSCDHWVVSTKVHTGPCHYNPRIRLSKNGGIK